MHAQDTSHVTTIDQSSYMALFVFCQTIGIEGEQIPYKSKSSSISSNPPQSLWFGDKTNIAYMGSIAS
jgi:hypothetical protein